MREDYFNLVEIATALGIGYTTMRRIIDRVPSFPARKVGGSWVIQKKQFYDWFANLDNYNMLDDMFDGRVFIDYERLREEGKRYDLYVMRRGNLQHILREEEKKRMYKTHKEF